MSAGLGKLIRRGVNKLRRIVGRVRGAVLKIIEFAQLQWLRFAPASVEGGIKSSDFRGAHWFSCHDPVNFWDAFRPSVLDDEFNQLRGDGFNTVFLLLPWHAFFPRMDAEADPWYVERLRYVLATAQRHRLRVVGRLFYEHSASHVDKATPHARQYALLNEPGSAEIIRAQAGTLAEIVAAFPAWAEAFVSWEDFWACFEGPPHWPLSERQAAASRSGFAQWVDSDVGEREAMSVGLERIDGVWAIPKHGTPSMTLWVRFFDKLFRERVLQPCRDAFPNIGAEVRIDAYPIANKQGGIDWQYFDLYRDLPGRRFVYWGPYYGQRNQGEQLTAERAASGLETLLRRFPITRPPVVDQLNFQDGTLHFASSNARIAPDQVGQFLSLAAARLRRRQAGYAVWASRDYRENWIANPSFQKGSDGWRSSLGAVTLRNGDVLQLAPGEIISQRVTPARSAQARRELYPDFFVALAFAEPVAMDSGLRLRLASELMPLHAQSTQEIVWSIRRELVDSLQAWNEGVELAFENAGSHSVQIVTVYFWGFTQTLGVRAHDAMVGPYLPAIQALNRQLGAHR